MKRSVGRYFPPGAVLFLVVCAVCSQALLAQENEITVQPATVHVGEAVQIVVTLNGDLATADSISLPLQNLVIDNGPSVASQFQWVNGDVSRQKVFTYAAHAVHPGSAQAGPLMFRDRNNRQTVVPPFLIEVLPELEVSAGSPEETLRDLRAAGKQRVFILPEIDRKSVTVGEQVVVTWYLYSADSVRDLEIHSMPSFTDFWAEELPIESEPTRELPMAGTLVQKVPIRRLALFPLHSGKVIVGPLAAVAEVIEPVRDPFGFFSLLDRTVQTVECRSPKIDVDVAPLPQGTFAAVGTFVMSCSAAHSPLAGPVVLNVQVSGAGNLRSASPPRMLGEVDGRLEIQEGPVSVDRQRSRVRMTRNWKYLVFPAKSGTLHIPGLALTTFDPETNSARELQCDPSDVFVREISTGPAVASGAIAPPEATDSSRSWFLLAAGAAALLGIAVLLWSGRRPPAGMLRELTVGDDPRELRRRLYSLLEARQIDPRVLMDEASESGDAFRSLHSYLDAEERETLTHRRSDGELRRRASEFLLAWQRRG
ncbi:MAG: BatD family protein [Acidobacteriota bacterium]